MDLGPADRSHGMRRHSYPKGLARVAVERAVDDHTSTNDTFVFEDAIDLLGPRTFGVAIPPDSSPRERLPDFTDRAV